MADVTWPSISSAADETLAQLDALHRPQQAERLRHREAMAEMVSRLGESSEPWRDDEPFNPAPTVKGQPSPGRPAREEPTPFVPLPERTTHGGPFGPKVRAKLIAEALADR
jgi:hypothetical protein